MSNYTNDIHNNVMFGEDLTAVGILADMYTGKILTDAQKAAAISFAKTDPDFKAGTLIVTQVRSLNEDLTPAGLIKAVSSGRALTKSENTVLTALMNNDPLFKLEIAKIRGTATEYGALGITEPVEKYKRLFLRSTKKDPYRKKIGVHEMWVGGNKAGYHPTDALEATRTDLQLRRTTIYDMSWFLVKGYNRSNVSEWIEYFGGSIACTYYDARTYLRTLERETDPFKFLSFLKLSRSAGIEPIKIYDQMSFGSVTKKNALFMPPDHAAINCILGTFTKKPLFPTYLTGPLMVKEPFIYPDDNKFLALMDQMAILDFVTTGSPLSIANMTRKAERSNEKDFRDEIEKVRYGTYAGNEFYPAWCDQVLRFRERVLAYILKETDFTLFAAKLSDLSTLTTLSNYINEAAYQPLYAIDKEEFVDVYEPDRKTLVRNQMGTVKDFLIRSIIVADANGKARNITVRQALIMQFEMCVWILLVNQEKYYGRIAELENPGNILRENNIKPFQTDPWQNPFLVFDLAASKLAGKPVYNNVAGCLAQIPQAQQSVTDDFVSLKSMESIPAIRAKYLRTEQGTGGIFKSTVDIKGPGKTSGPWALAALAAAAGLYFMNK